MLNSSPNKMSRKYHRSVLENQTREIIGRVYDFMKKEARANYAEKLTDARWRTAEAAGVSESTVTRILRERTREDMKRREEERQNKPQEETSKNIYCTKQSMIEPFVESLNDEGIRIKLHEHNVEDCSEDVNTPPKKRRKVGPCAFSDSDDE